VIDRVQVVALAVSVVLLLAVLELVRRRKLIEEYALVWIAAALALIGISARRDLLDTAAGWVGIYYPPALLVSLLVVLVFIGALAFSVIVSRHRRQIERLIEDTAVLTAEMRQLREEVRDAPRDVPLASDSRGASSHVPASGSPNRPR
jgi:glycerol-3-phosphate acyltransferase PlsY